MREPLFGDQASREAAQANSQGRAPGIKGVEGDALPPLWGYGDLISINLPGAYAPGY
jgi:hypothetical protein